MLRHSMNRRQFLGSVGASVIGAWAVPASAQERCGSPNYNYVAACEVGIPSWQGDVILRQQPYLSQWCWAASMEMVFAYYGYRVNMTRIVQEVYGRAVNLPAMSWTIVQQLSRRWIDDNGRRFSCQCDVLWDTAAQYGKPAPHAIASQYLHRRQPLIIGSLGHAMVLTAMSYNKHLPSGFGEVTNVIVRDPYPGRGGRRQLSAQEWVSTQFLAAPIISQA